MYRKAQNGSHITDFCRSQSLSAREHIVRWPKPASRPQWMAHEQCASAPDEIVLRECKVAHRVLVTSLHDHRRVSKDDLSQLYAQRWNVELDPRELSFKHTAQLWSAWVARGLSATQDSGRLLTLIAPCRVRHPTWPYRTEKAKTKAKILPLAENPKSARSQQSQAVRP